MGYCSDESMVRVDFFRESGKWYCTEAIKWDRYNTTVDGEYESLNATLYRCCKEQLGGRLSGMYAVCLAPYSENEYPLMIRIP